ncbi:MAG TPA: response regulator [Gemmatimonadaceae bacterium]|nr:response regulator [Gemmatimonadaceae bacterium]
MSFVRILRSFAPVVAESDSPRLYQALGPVAAMVCVGTYVLTTTVLHGLFREPFHPAGTTNVVGLLGSLVALRLMRRGRALAGTRLLLLTVVCDTVADMMFGPGAFDPVMVFIPNVLVGACLLLGARDALVAGAVYVVAIPLSVPWRAMAAAGYPSEALGGVVMTELACGATLLLVLVSRQTILQLAQRAEALAGRLGVMIDRAPDGIVVIDEAGLVRHVNRAAERCLAPHTITVGAPLAPMLLRFDGQPADVAYLRAAGDQLVRAYVRESGRDLAITGASLELGDGAEAMELILRDVSPRPRESRESRETRGTPPPGAGGTRAPGGEGAGWATGDAPAPADGGPHALVVDDEGAVREIVRRQLQRLGWRVTACAGGAEALDELAHHGDAIDLLVSDVRMPSMDGGELARRARALRPSLPIILMSGDTAGLTHGLVLPGRPWLALPKPFDGDQLREAIEGARGVGA